MAGTRRYTDEQYAEAESMLAEGVSFAETERATGINKVMLYRRYPQFKRRKDPTPGGQPKPSGNSARSNRSKSGKVTDEQLVEFFAKAATLPAIPMGFYCNYCADHFAKRGPAAAKQLVILSAQYPYLRAVMEGLLENWQKAAWASVLIGYFGVPIAHHALPDRYYWAAQFAGMPPRGRAGGMFTDVHASHSHDEGNTEAASTPFAGLDLGSLAGMAEMMGIRVDLSDIDMATLMDEPVPVTAEDVEVTDDGTDAEELQSAADESGDAASAPIEAEAVTADQESSIEAA